MVMPENKSLDAAETMQADTLVVYNQVKTKCSHKIQRKRKQVI